MCYVLENSIYYLICSYEGNIWDRWNLLYPFKRIMLRYSINLRTSSKSPLWCKMEVEFDFLSLWFWAFCLKLPSVESWWSLGSIPVLLHHDLSKTGAEKWVVLSLFSYRCKVKKINWYVFFGYMPRSGIAGPYGSSVFSFFKDPPYYTLEWLYQFPPAV